MPCHFFVAPLYLMPGGAKSVILTHLRTWGRVSLTSCEPPPPLSPCKSDKLFPTYFKLKPICIPNF